MNAAPYVTGETVESAVQDIQNIFIPALTDRSYDGWLEVVTGLITSVVEWHGINWQHSVRWNWQRLISRENCIIPAPDR